jgi:hypothetical protein
MEDDRRRVLDEALKGAKRRPMYKVLFNLALAYSNTANLPALEMSKSANGDFSAPMIMCRSFSIELLLKCLLLIDHRSVYSKKDLDAVGVELRGHKYNDLLQRISTQHKEEIVESYGSLFEKAVTWDFLQEQFAKIGDDPFVQWRYIYEKEGNQYIDFEVITRLNDAFGKCAEMLVRKLE